MTNPSVTIRNYLGNPLLLIDGIVNQITTIQTNKTVVHPLPGANKDFIQNMGRNNRRFTLKGLIFTLDGNSFIELFLAGYTGSIVFTGSNPIGETVNCPVFFTNINLQAKAGRPLEKTFTVEAIEVI